MPAPLDFIFGGWFAEVNATDVCGFGTCQGAGDKTAFRNSLPCTWKASAKKVWSLLQVCAAASSSLKAAITVSSGWTGGASSAAFIWVGSVNIAK